MLELKDICISYGDRKILDQCDLHLGRGERVALMGPSGCGKTTLMRVALSLQRPDSGSVRVGTERVAAVFQEARLLPWLTAEENVALVLADPAIDLQKARGWLSRMQIAEAAGRYPAQLSGGMQQRVSLARALATEPELLLMDEPFKALDEALREDVIQTLREALPRCAILLITHERREAEALGCTILQYQAGRFLGEG